VVDERLGEFLEACGINGPLKLRVTDASGNEVDRLSLSRPFAMIGRDSRAEVRLDHDQVSRRHTYLQVLAGRVLCVDLESREGLTLDAVHEPSGWLGCDGVLGVRPYRIQLADADGMAAGGLALPPPLAALTLWPDAKLPQAVLEGPSSPDGPRRHELVRVVNLVGRTRDCRLRIHDGSVSRHHCAFLRTPGGLFVVDLLSREGTLVNGARVRWSRLDEGDSIEIGRYRARIGLNGQSMLPAVRSSRSPSMTFLGAATAEPIRAETADAAVEALFQPLVAQFGRMQEQMFDQFHQSLMTMLQLVGTLHRDQMTQARQELDHIGQITKQLQIMQADAARAADAFPKSEPLSGLLPGQQEVSIESRSLRPPVREPIRRRASDGVNDPDIHELICRRVAELQENRQSHLQAFLGLLKVGGAKLPTGTTPAQV
jgi:pSer/pThr/pTyr-binding forkhead associated (FHA) protein